MTKQASPLEAEPTPKSVINVVDGNKGEISAAKYKRESCFEEMSHNR